MGSLQAIRYERGSLQLLDQRKLPLESIFIPIVGPEAAWTAIKDMAVRGAPAIAIAAALALAADLVHKGDGSQFASASEAAAYVQEQLAYLVTSRPTAVNLGDAAERLTKVAHTAAASANATGKSVTADVVQACEAMLADDVTANKAIGRFGAEGLLSAVEQSGRGRGKGQAVRVLTHCNTGSLATAEYGTALGVVRSLAEQGRLEHAYCTETRPYNQGARLTAYELVHDGLPATLICDSAAGALMAAGKVDAVVVGADRIAANGDTANKIGTFSLAVNAAHHRIPFFVAAPTTTLDPNLADGSLITIEQRPAEEVTHYQGRRIAAEGINVWNPSFDVTPQALVHGVITERGLIPKAKSGFAVRTFLEDQGMLADHHRGPSEEGPAANGVDCAQQENGVSSDEAPANSGSSIPGFRALDVDSVKDYLAGKPDLADRLGRSSSKPEWKVKEVGDGNINYVYIVEGPSGALCVKQALPYIRIAHDWKLTQDRVRFEADALREEARYCPEHVPEVYLYDPQLAVIVMQYLPPPHIILRVGLTQGKIYPRLAEHLAKFLAQTLFRTSLLALDSATWREKVAMFRNGDMCRLTEQVIFTDPYYAAPVNRHTSPQLDAEALALREDVEAKVAATQLKAKFCETAQALLHGDMHTGSLMVTSTSTFAIDAEFAVYGPIAFDVGKMMANLLLAYYAADGQASEGDDRTEQKRWLLQSVVDLWTKFSAQFLALWDAESQGGDLYRAELFGADATAGQQTRQAAQDSFMADLFTDALAFGGAVMIRRIVGIAHIIDFESIKDADRRAACEKRALHFGRELLVEPQAFHNVERVVRLAADQL